MTVITNVLGLPDAFVQAVANDTYDNGGADISVTSLIDPPRKVALQKRHDGETTEDVSDRIWALVGQIGHGILERANMHDLTEVRLFMDVLGWKLSGQFDNMTLTESEKGETLSEYKFVSAYEAKNGLKPERVQQLNIQAALARANGWKIDRLQAILILRDWSKLKAQHERDYPRRQVCIFPVPLWEPEKARAFIEERVRLHQAAQAGDLPLCTKEEQWDDGDIYAVIPKGNKRSKRNLESREAAETWAEANMSGKPWEIEFRPGTPRRCENYCRVAPFCSQHQEYLKSRQQGA